ncbi:DUF3221 domain-containing protein [Paenibacillus xylanilyticus]|uniref:DUF3221 domain-containing protein n=1 Tax=Paenibacillus xylanilyticus TaxID=248903 RepID=UPI00399FFC28
MRKPVIGAIVLTLLCSLSGCYFFSANETGDYIILKEEERILVAENIPQEEADSNLAALREKKIKVISYIVEDTELYEQLEVGDKVKVSPKVNEEGFYVVGQSDPPQIVAGKIEIEE